MFWLGLLATLCYIPGYTGFAEPTTWAGLSILLVPTIWRSPPTVSWFGLGFLAYVGLMVVCRPFNPDAGWELWTYGILALAFWLGSTTIELWPLWKGMAIGIGVSSAVAIAQASGYEPVWRLPVNDGVPGLLYNPVVLGYTAAVLGLILLTYRSFLWCLTVPAMLLSNSRGGFLVFTIFALAALWRKPWVSTLFALVAVVFIYLVIGSTHDAQRTAIWQAAYDQITLFGSGAGAFKNVWIFGEPAFRPDNTHNDFLGLIVEFGIVAVIPIVGAIRLTEVRHEREWYPFAACLVLALFSSPLNIPLLALIGGVCAGRLSLSLHLARRYRHYSRLELLPR